MCAQVTEASERLLWSLDLAQAMQLPGSFQALDVSLVPSLPSLPQTPSALVLAAARPADSSSAQVRFSFTHVMGSEGAGGILIRNLRAAHNSRWLL